MRSDAGALHPLQDDVLGRASTGPSRLAERGLTSRPARRPLAASRPRRSETSSKSRCFSTRAQSYVRFAGGDELDASVLLGLLSGYGDARSPRWRGTVDAVRRELGHGPLRPPLHRRGRAHRRRGRVHQLLVLARRGAGPHRPRRRRGDSVDGRARRRWPTTSASTPRRSTPPPARSSATSRRR